MGENNSLSSLFLLIVDGNFTLMNPSSLGGIKTGLIVFTNPKISSSS